MSILDKANKFVGHPEEVDEGYVTGMRRRAFIKGYEEAIEDACKNIVKLHNWPIQYEEFAKFQEEFLKEFRKMMNE